MAARRRSVKRGAAPLAARRRTAYARRVRRRLPRPPLPTRAGLACVALGGIAALGFAPLDLWPLTFAGVAAWLTLVAAAPSRRSGFLRGWAFGLGHFTVGNAWIATAFTYQAAMPAWLGWVAVVLLALYLAVYPGLAALAARSFGTRSDLGFVLAFAPAWIVSEWARATVFTGFAWNPLGVVWLPLSIEVARSAAWIGTYGLSGLAMLAAGALLLAWRRRWRQAGGIAVALVAVAVVGIRLPGTQVAGPATPRIDVVQPNIGQDDKYEADHAGAHFAALARLSRRTSPAPRLLLWPEAAVPDYLEEQPRARARIARLLGPRDLVLTGATALEYDRVGRLVGARNSVFAMDARGRLLERYDKAHLVPYGEYLPMRPLLSRIGLSRLAPGDLDFWPGAGPRTVALPGFGTVGLQVCYEIIFSGRVVDRAHRPDFIFNPSNDAWFGPSGPPQHLAQARLRAIEEGLAVVRATPTGVSAVIDAAGRVRTRLPRFAAAAIHDALPSPATPTPFARHGNLLPFLFAALLLLLAIAQRRRAR